MRSPFSTTKGQLQQARAAKRPRVGVRQYKADAAIGIIVEAIQQVALAIDDAAVALMFYLPATGAEPDEAIRKLDSSKRRLSRFFELADRLSQPRPPQAPRGEGSSLPRRR
jgi:hypothetical protein